LYHSLNWQNPLTGKKCFTVGVFVGKILSRDASKLGSPGLAVYSDGGVETSVSLLCAGTRIVLPGKTWLLLVFISIRKYFCAK
jgi:hypothetical protein